MVLGCGSPENAQILKWLWVKTRELQNSGRLTSVAVYSIPRHSMQIYTYIDPSNHPNVGIYGSPMECLGFIVSGFWSALAQNRCFSFLCFQANRRCGWSIGVGAGGPLQVAPRRCQEPPAAYDADV